MDIFVLEIYAADDRPAGRTWFLIKPDLSQYLCGTLYAYASDDGKVHDHDGEFIGRWFSATVQ